MNDDLLDQLLLDAGTAFRATHTRTPLPRKKAPRRSFGIVLPVVAGLATLLLVLSIALIHAGRPKAVVPASSSVQLDLSTVTATSASQDYVAIAGYTVKDLRPVVEVRSRKREDRVAFRAVSRYARGGVVCPLLQGDWLVYTNVQDLSVPHARGLATVTARNVKTGQSRLLSQWQIDTSGPDVPCAVGEDGTIAFRPKPDYLSVITLPGFHGRKDFGGLSTHDLGTHPDGVVNGKLIYHDSAYLYVAEVSTNAVHTIVRTPATYLEGISTGGGRVILSQSDGNDMAPTPFSIISTCSLPCRNLVSLGRFQEPLALVVAARFGAWSSSADTLTISFRQVDRVLPRRIQAGSLSTFQDTLVYASSSAAGGDVSLHLDRIPNPR